jgi:tRNA-dihydrouridine synthase B
VIKSIKLGNLTFSNNIIQGPLAGISCSPFRALTWKYGRPAFSATEMISCKTLIHQPIALQERFIHKDSQEGPVCFQLSSNDPIELAEATKRVTGYGADLIDLNCGCPVKKIRSKGAGSSLLMNASKLAQLVAAMRANTHVPISIKIRVEGHSNDKFNDEIIKVVNESGLDYLTVHGRHWTEHYETPCNYEEIRYFVQNVKVPVIGNGDVACLNTLQSLLSTGCAGVMIGRAGVGQPWLAKQLISEINNIPFVLPSIQETGQMLIDHVSGLINLLSNEKFALLQTRTFAKYYAKRISERAAFCETLNNCTTYSEFLNVTSHYFQL